MYSKLNLEICRIIKNSAQENKSDIVLELDGGNGILGTLLKNDFKKFYSIQQYHQSVVNSYSNLIDNSNLSDTNNEFCKIFSKLQKSTYYLNKILEENDKKSRISVVYQNFEKPLSIYDSRASEFILKYFEFLN